MYLIFIFSIDLLHNFHWKVGYLQVKKENCIFYGAVMIFDTIISDSIRYDILTLFYYLKDNMSNVIYIFVEFITLCILHPWRFKMPIFNHYTKSIKVRHNQFYVNYGYA